MESETQVLQHRSLSVNLWPPSHGTRIVIVEWITKNLTTPSHFSRKNGLLGNEEAEEFAKEIEDLAFAVADDHYKKYPDGNVGFAVRIYAKESSGLMLEVIKRDRKVNDGELADEARETVFDISDHGRSFIDAVEAEELLKPLGEPGNSYTKICFSNISFGLDAANVAASILSSVKDRLTEVDLSGFIARRPESEALEVMNIFSSVLEGCHLRYLNLSNNALGEKGVRAFGVLLKSQNSLEELYLMNDDISEEAARAVSELIPSTEKLKVLHFHNNMTGDEGAVAISEIVKRSPALEDFRCSSTRVGTNGGLALAEALKTCTGLKKLDLHDNMFGVEPGVALSKVVSQFADLTEVNLSYLNLQDEGAKALADALKDFAPFLEVLEMAGNGITAKGAASLAVCVASKQFLTTLNLADNELKDEGAILIAKALGEGHGQLNEGNLAQVVVRKPGFKLLYINGNFISNKGIDEVKELFKSSPEILGPLDKNDSEGEDEDGEENAEKEMGLEFKLKDLEIRHLSSFFRQQTFLH
ncbi:RAN GTPase activating protein 1, RAN GTPASE-ACTIVATING PROTEIN 1 [Hibiscus trionum]|uniref:RAN GTPase activating protein 1, RAN GTPASE-ACTIVATING PROTEIN 1 n=1 Tax=Hibiscus trionum TaxID=183268 RepID=A0A9W7HAM8_HIBTR|nr:RAN GTPase activating protein 1, RAN GTPASE-ACTIVATING PROTEIN 1 [Hibiscus trionum]